MPTAPGVVSTACNKSSSDCTTIAAWRVSFSLAMAVLASEAPPPKSLCSATRISGRSGFFNTITKFFPSGHAFAEPLQYLTNSASGTSASLLPTDVTTAIFLIAGTTGVQTRANKIEAHAKRNDFSEDSLNIPTSPFEQAPCSIGGCRGRQKDTRRNKT